MNRLQTPDEVLARREQILARLDPTDRDRSLPVRAALAEAALPGILANAELGALLRGRRKKLDAPALAREVAGFALAVADALIATYNASLEADPADTEALEPGADPRQLPLPDPGA